MFVYTVCNYNYFLNDLVIFYSITIIILILITLMVVFTTFLLRWKIISLTPNLLTVIITRSILFPIPLVRKDYPFVVPFGDGRAIGGL